MSPAPDSRTIRGRIGRDAEDVAHRFLESLGWRILARNLVVGRDEIDLVCLDADGPALVCVEVRGHSTSRFGAAEESVDHRKLARNQRAAMALVRSGWMLERGVPAWTTWRCARRWHAASVGRRYATSGASRWTESGAVGRRSARLVGAIGRESRGRVSQGLHDASCNLVTSA